MNNLILSFNVVLPLVIMMCLGYLLKRLVFFDNLTSKKMNSVIFKVLLPMSIFYNVYTSDLKNVVNPFLSVF